jgi:hypothetical protein
MRVKEMFLGVSTSSTCGASDERLDDESIA